MLLSGRGRRARVGERQDRAAAVVGRGEQSGLGAIQHHPPGERGPRRWIVPSIDELRVPASAQVGDIGPDLGGVHGADARHRHLLEVGPPVHEQERGTGLRQKQVGQPVLVGIDENAETRQANFTEAVLSRKLWPGVNSRFPFP